jgi:hypothetical protein
MSPSNEHDNKGLHSDKVKRNRTQMKKQQSYSLNPYNSVPHMLTTGVFISAVHFEVDGSVSHVFFS